MRKLLIFWLAALINGCASTPPTSDIVLMAASHADKNNNNLESSPWACLKFDDSPVDKKQLIETIVDKALEKETGFDKEQRQQVVYLLMSGKFTSDLHDLVALTLSLPSTTMNTAPSMGESFVSLPTDLYGCLTQRQCANPANVVNQKETFRKLLDNQSFRFALIAYAHANGIDISDEDLTFVQNQLRKDEIDMENLMNEGKQRLKEKYKVAEFEARLACLEQ